jgi:hypothetical protein
VRETVHTIVLVRRLHVILPFAVLTAVAGAVSGSGSFILPGAAQSIPLPVLLAVVGGVLVAAPLTSSATAEIGPVARVRHERAIALLLSLSLTVLSVLPAVLVSRGSVSWNEPLSIIAVALASVVLFDRFAWLPTTIASIGGMYLDLSSLGALSQALRDSGPWPSVACLAVSAAFVVVGPVCWRGGLGRLVIRKMIHRKARNRLAQSGIGAGSVVAGG